MWQAIYKISSATFQQFEGRDQIMFWFSLNNLIELGKSTNYLQISKKYYVRRTCNDSSLPSI